MMILRSSPASPFVRKVRIAASVLGLADKIEVRETDLNSPADSIRVQNPVGKIPALILDDGEALLRLARDPRISRSSRRRRPHHSARAEGALRGAAAAGAVRRHSRCQPAAGLRRPLPAGRDEGAKLGRSPGRQSRTRLGRAGSRAPGARSRRPMSARSRSPACSAIAICASAAVGVKIIRAWSPGSTNSPLRCRPSRRQKWPPEKQKPRSEPRGFAFGVLGVAIRSGS